MPTTSLPRGETHYELTGPLDGRTVVLLHGGTVPMWTWDRQLPALTDAGFRVLRYDMFGKGRSAIPRVRYDRELFRMQLLDLLDTLAIHSPVHLVGFSFGGATAANFSASHPDRVASLALVAPLVWFDRGNAVVRGVRLPFVGPIFLRHVVLPKMIARAGRIWGAGAEKTYASLFRQQFERKGFAEGMLSFMRSDALGDYRPAYRTLGAKDRRVLLVWGTEDEDVSASEIAFVREAIRGIDYVELEGVAHGSLFGATERVNDALVRFLAADPGATA